MSYDGSLMESDTEIELAVESELARRDSEPVITKILRSAIYWSYRLLIRFAWILFGLVLGAIAVWCASLCINYLNKPIASLSIINFVQLALALYVGLVTGVGALKALFAPPGLIGDMRAQIARSLRDRLRRRRAEALEVAALRSDAEKWYRYSRTLGILFDASLIKRYKWLPFVAVFVGYVVIFSLIAIISNQS